MRTHDIATWPDQIERQDGVLSRRAARLGGLSEEAWQWQLDTGRWRPVLPGIAVCHTGMPTQRQVAWAAVLSTGDDGVLTADGALVEYGFEIDVSHLDVLVAPHRRLKRKRLTLPPDGRVVMVRPWPDGRARSPSGGGLPLTSRSQAVLDAFALAPSDRAAEWRVAAAVQQGITTVPDLRAGPRLSIPQERDLLLRAVLDDVECGATARSELDFLDFLREQGLPLPDRLQRPVRANGLRYLDAWWERQRVAAEVDGGHHRNARSWDADTMRANDVVLAERHARMLLLRLTMGNLRHDRPRLATQFRTALL